jgi:surfeit locus 1 family protein
MKRFKDLVFLAAAGLGILFLLQLGFWQLQRLEWKLALIADMNAAIAGNSPAISLKEAQARFAADPLADYLPVAVSGTWQPEARYLYAIVDGRPGWHVVNAVGTADPELALVNRGAIPDELRGEVTPVSGLAEIKGFARRPQPEAGWFQPESQPEAGLFYWRDAKSMAGGKPVFPFIIEAQPVAGASAWPRPEKADPASLTNNHLSYAITWFSLAGVLAVMTGIFIATRRNSSTARPDA